jgi:uncharacterized MAPEG superfamily protein
MPGQDIFAHTAPIEAASVIVAAVLVWLSALVQHLSNVSERGPQYVMSDRSVAPPLQGFFGRATRTLANNIESALMWVPPVAIILLLHRTSWLSQLLAAAYIGARIVFALCYWLKIPVVRSLAWFAGMICCAGVTVLAMAAIG